MTSEASAEKNISKLVHILINYPLNSYDLELFHSPSPAYFALKKITETEENFFSNLFVVILRKNPPVQVIRKIIFHLGMLNEIERNIVIKEFYNAKKRPMFINFVQDFPALFDNAEGIIKTKKRGENITWRQIVQLNEKFLLGIAMPIAAIFLIPIIFGSLLLVDFDIKLSQNLIQTLIALLLIYVSEAIIVLMSLPELKQKMQENTIKMEE